MEVQYPLSWIDEQGLEWWRMLSIPGRWYTLDTEETIFWDEEAGQGGGPSRRR